MKETVLKRIFLNRSRFLLNKYFSEKKETQNATGTELPDQGAPHETKSIPVRSFSEGVLQRREECGRTLDQALYLSYLQKIHNGLQ